MATQEIMDILAGMVSERIEGAETMIQEIRKTNGRSYLGAVIRVDGASGSPVIPVDKVLRDVETHGLSLSEAADLIVAEWKDMKGQKGVADAVKAFPFSKTFILDTVKIRMLNWRDNKEILSDVPHRDMLDLSAVYFCSAEQEDGMVSVMVNNKMMEAYDISQDELDEAATRNSEAEGYAVRLFSMNCGLMDIDRISDRVLFEAPMVILTSDSNMYGARVMLCPGFIKRLADRLGTDLYILPSSIHEVLAVRADEADRDVLRDIVMTVNATAVAPEDILSNSVYFFDRKTQELAIA